MNLRHDRDVHFVQMWVPPDTEQIPPGYEPLDINAQLDSGGLVPIASGRGHAAAISLRQQGAVLWGGRLKPGVTVRVPDAPFVHVFVAREASRWRARGRWRRAMRPDSPAPAPGN
jgi:quercetin 2,3-dioxygenase